MACARRAATSLTRRYIRDCLYNPSYGYFSSDDVLYSPSTEERDASSDGGASAAGEHVDFREMYGLFEYQMHLKKVYKTRESSWLTPVEIFSPWYSFAIAKYIVQQCRERGESELRIVEMGGGAGTNAASVLDYVRATDPELYERTRYTLVDISAAMSARQSAKLRGAGHAERCDCLIGDFLKWGGDAPFVDVGSGAPVATGVVDEGCFVISLEVLDNMPHDKVVSIGGGPWLETVVETSDVDGARVEVHRPLDDALVREAVAAFGIDTNVVACSRDAVLRARSAPHRMAATLFNTPPPEHERHLSAFVPTGALKMLHVLRDSFPSHRFIAADFDYLPPPDLSLSAFATHARAVDPAFLEPLVAGRHPESGKHVDYPDYLSAPPGAADIFFPTDFGALQLAYNAVLGRHAHVAPSAEFLAQYAEVDRTTVKGGYNPMLEDYKNTVRSRLRNACAARRILAVPRARSLSLTPLSPSLPRPALYCPGAELHYVSLILIGTP